MYTPIRYQQRFQNFEKSYTLLKSIATVEHPSEGEKMGLIQAFEMCFELSWKMMNDYLEFNGYAEVKGPRETLKKCLQDGILHHADIWMDMLEKRNQTVHLYDEEIAKQMDAHLHGDYLIAFDECYQYFQQKFSES